MNFSKYSNLAGVIVGLAFIVLAIGLSAEDPMAFVNLPGLLIVFGGTLTAILVSVPFKDAIFALKEARVVIDPLTMNLNGEVNKILHFSKLGFRQQFDQLDNDISRLKDPFLQRGLQMVRDDNSIEDIMSFLNWKITQYRAKEASVINLFRSMATFAPAFGMVGSLLGLVNMLQGLGSGGLASVTSDMAIALVTTFYGLLLANLVFKPIASKLEQRRNQHVIALSLLSEGIALIHQNRTPSVVRDTLMSFVQEQDNEMPQTMAAEKTTVQKSMMAKFGA
ncbi:MAG: chemotaxis protein MotA [Oleiphilaceae bacterium]|jgi:chemotaxis protein MotA